MPPYLPVLLTFLVHYALLGLLVKLQDADFLTHNSHNGYLKFMAKSPT